MREQSVISYLRRGRGPHELAVVVCNFTPVPREDYRIGVPRAGRYRERINTDAVEYGGSGVGNAGEVHAEPHPMHGHTTLSVAPAAACHADLYSRLAAPSVYRPDPAVDRSTARARWTGRALIERWLSAKVWPGRPYPLGATWDGKGVNFALFSAHAEKVELCLFDRSGQHEEARIVLPEYTDEVWHGYLPEARPGPALRLPRVWPLRPADGHRFNPNKLLLDPYARALSGRLRWSDAVFGYRVGGPREDLAFDRRDSARYMPKCRVVEPRLYLGRRPPPADPLGGDDHPRNARARLHDAPSRGRPEHSAALSPRSPRRR